MTIRVIDNKRYDTDKAELVFTFSEWTGPGDGCFETIHLYRTAKGAWFEHYQDRDPEVIEVRDPNRLIESLTQEASRNEEAITVLKDYFEVEFDEA